MPKATGLNKKYKIMNKIFTTQHKTGLYDARANGLVTIAALFRILQETASEHHIYVNNDLRELYRQGYGWVLASARIEIIKHPHAGTDLTIDTWISEIVKFRAQREYIVKDNDDNILAKAQKKWIYFDIKTRRIARVSDEIKAKWPVVAQKVIEQDFSKPLTEIEPDREDIVCVRRSDMDMNNHVNNIKFIEWIDETLPEEFFDKEIKYFEGHFLSEAHKGDKIKVEASTDKNENIVLMDNNTTGKKCFFAKTTFNM